MSENCAVHLFASGPPDEAEAFRRDVCAHLAADCDACGLRVVTAEPNAESPRNLAATEEARAGGKDVLHILFHTRDGEPPPLGFLDPIISRHPACDARVVWTDHGGDEGEETLYRAGAATRTTEHDYGSAYEAAWGERDEHPAGEEGEGGAGYGDDGVPAVYADPAYESFTIDPREGDVRVTDHGLDRARVAVTLVLLPDAAAAVVFRDAVARRFHNRMLSDNWEHATPLPGGNGVAMMFWDGTDSMGIANDALRAPGLHVCDLRPGRRPARLSLDEHTQITLRYRDRLRGDRLPSRDYSEPRSCKAKDFLVPGPALQTPGLLFSPKQV